MMEAIQSMLIKDKDKATLVKSSKVPSQDRHTPRYEADR